MENKVLLFNFQFCILNFLRFFIKNAFIKDDYQGHAHGDAGIGEIEDGREKPSAAPQRKAFGNGKQPDVDHIHHLAIEERGISAAFGEERGNRKRCALIEDEAVKHTVNDVTQRACNDETEGDQDRNIHFVALDQAMHVPTKEHHQHNAQECEQQFADILSET